MLASTLSPTDWAVLGAYFALIALSGWWFSRRKVGGTQDYFLGGRTMPVWAVAISVIATSLSAASFVGVPQLSYAGNLKYLSTNIGSLLAVVLVAWLFIPVYYRENVTSIYELFERRMGPGAKTATSAAFMLGRVLASGARLYIGAIPLALILFGDEGATIPRWQLCAAIGVMAGVAVAYTLAGGIASVIWTEVVQTAVLVGAVVAAIVLLLHRIEAPAGEVARALADAGKLTVVEASSFSIRDEYSLPSVVIAFALFGVAAYGTDHDLAQRMLTCRSAIRGGQSAIVAILLGMPIIVLFMVVGLLLFVFYQRPDLAGHGGAGYAPGDTRKVFLTFILREMPRGMSGLMIAGLFSVGISSLASALNAMAATFVKDIWVHVGGRDEKTGVRVGRWAVVGWGLVLGGFACACVAWQEGSQTKLIDFALSVMTFAYAGLLGAFATALFTRRGSTWSVIAAIVVGAAAVLALQDTTLDWVRAGVGQQDGHWSDVLRMAWPWRLVVASAAAFATCCLGARPGAVAA